MLNIIFDVFMFKFTFHRKYLGTIPIQIQQNIINIEVAADILSDFKFALAFKQVEPVTELEAPCIKLLRNARSSCRNVIFRSCS